jgi:hypothetical protein
MRFISLFQGCWPPELTSYLDLAQPHQALQRVGTIRSVMEFRIDVWNKKIDEISSGDVFQCLVFTEQRQGICAIGDACQIALS